MNSYSRSLSLLSRGFFGGDVFSGNVQGTLGPVPGNGKHKSPVSSSPGLLRLLGPPLLRWGGFGGFPVPRSASEVSVRGGQGRRGQIKESINDALLLSNALHFSRARP